MLGFKIWAILAYVPNVNPHSPKIRIPISFHIIQLYRPKPTGQNVIISIIGGAIRANAELLIAPTSEIIGPKFGMHAAKITENKNLNFL